MQFMDSTCMWPFYSSFLCTTKMSVNVHHQAAPIRHVISTASMLQEKTLFLELFPCCDCCRMFKCSLYFPVYSQRCKAWKYFNHQRWPSQVVWFWFCQVIKWVQLSLVIKLKYSMFKCPWRFYFLWSAIFLCKNNDYLQLHSSD